MFTQTKQDGGSMHRFYIEESQKTGDRIVIVGEDVNHIKNVLRMKQKDKLILCNGEGIDYYCVMEQIETKQIEVKILSKAENHAELPGKIYLFQGLPKKDKMELIIQKTVELGVYEIIPVAMKRSIVKIEEKKKEQKKLERWQMIAQSAAKQSGRGVIPKIKQVVSFQEAILLAKQLEWIILPYENASDSIYTKQIIQKAAKGATIGIFIGPEGGFDETEIALAEKEGAFIITLGERILRTETAGLCLCSLFMYEMEWRKSENDGNLFR